jgi:hypothetical protein
MSKNTNIVDFKQRQQGNMFDGFDVSEDEESENEEVIETKKEEVISSNYTYEGEEKIVEDTEEAEDEWTEVKRKHDVDLIYPRGTWQYKVITNRYIFEDDGQLVLDVFEIKKLFYKFKKAKNNYIRNKLFRRLLRVITDEAWESIKNMVIEKGSRKKPN